MINKHVHDANSCTGQLLAPKLWTRQHQQFSAG